MAVLGKAIRLPDFDWKAARGQSEHELAFAELEAASDAAREKGQIKGRIIKFQYADGYAVYRIEKLRPLTLAHVDWLDGWALDADSLRDLSLATVKSRLDQADRIRTLWASKGWS